MPPFPDSSCLKKLVADHFSIQSKPGDPVHYKEMILTSKEGDDDEDDNGDDDDDIHYELLMMMMMMMMMMIFFSGLKSLPLLPASSCLKTLNAENCDIQSLPDNLFCRQLEVINLKGNKG